MQYFKTILLVFLCITIMGCATIGRNFDDTKIQQIKNGATTQAEILQIFGEPYGKSVCGFLHSWRYQHAHDTIVNPPSVKTLIIRFDKNDIVYDYMYSESGR